jgi:dihydroorotate dehydrogenase (fumarate)
MLLAGADVCHMTAALLQHGAQHISQMLEEMTQWLEKYEYESVSQLKGSISQANAVNPVDYERANYISLLQNYR